MKTHLSHIMPVWKACEILGEPVVQRIGSSLLSLRQSASNKQHQHGVEPEMGGLIEALFYRPDEMRPIDPLEDPTGTMRQEPSVPPHIAVSWNRWLNTKALQLDKATLLAFLVPNSVQPSSAGHMGLFDCLVYALQGHDPVSATGHYGPTPGPNNKNTIWLPDILILLAVCRQYARDRHNISRTQAEEDQKSERRFQQDQKIIWTMALLAYRIYDSYLKKGIFTRDTVHRFLTDVYGDDSYKKPHVKALLDVLFHPANDEPAPLSPLEASITEAQFCRRCLDTMRPNGEHLLLDWIVTLVNAMAPTPHLPGSITAYLETMNSTRPPLCQVYALADHRLYEIKRRFHSMVQQQLQHYTMLSSPLMIQGDAMTDSTSNNNNNNSAAAASPNLDSSQSSAAASSVNSSSKIISEAAFCHFVTRSSEEMGFGGHLTTALAKLVFRAGCRTDTPTMIVQPMHGNSGWGLFHVLQFGCIAVRLDTIKKEDLDVQLLRFLFGMFQLRPPSSQSSAIDDSHSGWMCEDEDDGVEIDKQVLTRQQIAWMLLRLLEYAEFRVQADRSPLEQLDDLEEDEHSNEKFVTPDARDVEQTKLNLKTAVRLGLLLPPEGSNPSDCVTLQQIVDITLQQTESQQQMTFEEFCTWNGNGIEEKKRERGRLYPLIMELRLIAAVQFGIPPTLASTEIAVIGEIDRRHRSRYPQSEVSRRGPRGTVWNIIDAAWSSSWKALVKKVAGTVEDHADGRGDPRNDRVRGLSRISNTGLLVENGSLSLRPDIRWHHDYELLPPLAWSALQAWYDGGPPIHRSVVKYVASSGATTSPHSSRESRIPTENEIELYPFFVTVYLCDAASRGEARPFQQNYQLSRVSPIMVMLVQLCRELDVDPDRARLWVMGSHSSPNFGNSYSSLGNDTAGQDDPRSEDWILNTDMNIVDQLKRRGIPKDGGKILLLELKDKESGKWPRGVDGKEWTFRDRASSEHAPADIGDGVVGLYNMGNTCYMSTSIQCLSHTPILREYFTSKAFYKDINKTNPLGYEGRLAQVSAVLINELWKRSNTAVPHQPKRITAPNSYSLLSNAPALTPKTFKESLGKFNDIFQGNEQHDAQELLAFLLGGLSEDLNRIMEKPYIEAPDSDGRPDHELADIWWSNHLKRELSIIVALFTGQYKSLLTCRTCKYESARFEPFTFLQLPLPEDEHLSISLILYSVKEGAPPMRYCVRVKNDGSLGDVLIALAKILHQDEIEDGEEVSSASPPIPVQPASTKEEQEWEETYLERAKNMSVVVMREGYIAKMAPGNWLLQDQQNKESGEIPLLHVYELDPIAQVDESELSDSDAREEAQGAIPRPTSSVAHLAIAQRRSELISRDFLHPLAHRVFGTPLLIRISNFDKVTGRNLYDIIAKRLKSVVPKSALRFLSSHPEGRIPDSPSFEDSPLRTPEGNSNRRLESTTRTTTDMEEVAAGQVPRYGFRLRITSRDGRRCLTCKWYECCIGCLVPDDDSPTVVEDGDSLVVDWHFAVEVATSGFGLRVSTGDAIFANQPAPARIRTPPITIKNHSSCGGIGQRRGTQPGAVTLEECLDAFAKEEKIPEAYCSKCKDFRVQTKRMSLWRLPPVMIIHLKRFQFTPTMRRKLRELVVFPIEGLDLSRIMAPSSVTKENGNGGKRLEGSDGKTSEELKDDGRSEMLYDLYGVIHHQGALSGGHYVASIKSEIDGQWRLFNDAQIYEINARDVVDPSAYILFYIRRDVSTAQLSDFWDVRDGNGLSDEDMDQLLKGRSDRCVVS